MCEMLPPAEAKALLSASAAELLERFREVMVHFEYSNCSDLVSREAKELNSKLSYIDLTCLEAGNG